MTPEKAIEMCRQNIVAKTLDLEKSPYRILRDTCRNHIADSQMVIDIYEGKNVPAENIDTVIESFEKQRLHAQVMLSDCFNSLGLVKKNITQSYKTYVEWMTECILILQNYKAVVHNE